MGLSSSRSLPIGRCVQRSQSPTSSDLLLGSPYVESPRRAPESCQKASVCSSPATSLGKAEDSSSSEASKGGNPATKRDFIIHEEMGLDVSISSRSTSSKAKGWALKLYGVEASMSREEMSSVVEKVCSVIGAGLISNKTSTQATPTDNTAECEKAKSPVPVATEGCPSSTTTVQVNPPGNSSAREQAVADQSPIPGQTSQTIADDQKHEDTTGQVTQVDPSSSEQPACKRRQSSGVGCGDTTEVSARGRRTRRRREKACSTCGQCKLQATEETIIHVHHHEQHTHQHHHSTKELTKGQISETERQAEKSTSVTLPLDSEQLNDMTSELNVAKKKHQKRRIRDVPHRGRHPRNLEEVRQDILELYLSHKLAGKCTDFFQFQSTLKAACHNSEPIIRHIHHHHHHTHHHHHQV